MNDTERYGLASLLLNIPLLVLKTVAALSSGSLTMLSSAFDSLNDLISYLFSYYAIRETERGPDEDHPFGHRRVGPAAAIVMAMLAALLSFEILKSAVLSLLKNDHAVTITGVTFAVLGITIIIKAGMYILLKKRAGSNTALEAMMMDSRNDVLFNSIAVIGVAGTAVGYVFFDDVIAIIIALYIGYTGYNMAKKNYNYMTGARPDKSVLDAIMAKAGSVDGVKKVENVRAHYVGDRVHAEIEILLDRKVNAIKSHTIAVAVQKAVESVKDVDRVFVHVDYD